MTSRDDIRYAKKKNIYTAVGSTSRRMKRVKPRNAVTVTPGAPLRKIKQQKEEERNPEGSGEGKRSI
jgi:hypothetical protein